MCTHEDFSDSKNPFLKLLNFDHVQFRTFSCRLQWDCLLFQNLGANLFFVKIIYFFQISLTLIMQSEKHSMSTCVRSHQNNVNLSKRKPIVQETLKSEKRSTVSGFQHYGDYFMFLLSAAIISFYAVP